MIFILVYIRSRRESEKILRVRALGRNESTLNKSSFLSALVSVADKERLLKEVSIMLSFNHSNVMPLVGLCIEGEMPLLIMPFMFNGSMLEYVRKKREKLYFIEKTDRLEVSNYMHIELTLCMCLHIVVYLSSCNWCCI